MKKEIEPELDGQIELSRPLKIDGIPRAGIEERIVAKPVEREAIAKRLRLLELGRFEATITVEHEKGHMFKVKGGIYAELSQECVVTLEPVEEVVRESFDFLMAPDYVLARIEKGGQNEMGDLDEVEPIHGGIIDLGELAVQYLAMSLNPYPRKEGAVWQGKESKDLDKTGGNNPFLQLVKGGK